MRAKKYDVTQEMVDKLKEGQIFKNFTDLSNYLGVLNSKGKPLGGKSRDYFLQELNRYVELQKADNCYAITVARIRPEDEILPPRPEGGNNKYSATLQNMLAYHLLENCKEEAAIELFWSSSDILSSCGMVNHQFSSWPVSCDKKIRSDALAFKYNSKAAMLEYIDTAFHAMEKNGELVYEKRLVFIKIEKDDLGFEERTYYFPTKEEMAIYLKMKTQIISDFMTVTGKPCETEQDIFLSGQSDSYYSALNNEFSNRFPYSMALKLNYIVTEPSSLQRTIKRTENVVYPQEFIKMNQLMCENLPHRTSVSRGRKITVPNPAYKPENPIFKDQPKYLYKNKVLSDDDMAFFIDKMIRVTKDVKENQDIPKARIAIKDRWAVFPEEE